MSFKPSGTYSVLFTVIPLPKSILQSLLPPNLFESLLPVPDELNVDVQEGEHVVILQLGRQIQTGAQMYRFDAQEAKLEIPFLQHPSSPSAPSSPFPVSAARELNALPCVYKHSLFGSAYLLTVPARLTIGLRTAKATFNPPEAPLEKGGTDENKAYEVVGHIEWKGRKAVDEEADAGIAWRDVHKLMEDWWFGDWTKSKITRFNFSSTGRVSIPYIATVRLHLPSFQLGPAPTTNPTLRQGYTMEGDWLKVENIKTWWSEMSWEMVGPKELGEVEIEAGIGLDCPHDKP